MATDPARDAYEQALRHVARLSTGPPLDPRFRVAVNFHPDRPHRDGLLVVQALARDGAYRSQFVTGISNGGLAAHPGGDRWRWERRMFGGAYDGLIALAEADVPDDPLDAYVEAHVHGPVRLDSDVEAVVLDPSHRHTCVETAARRFGCPVEWHAGFRLTVSQLHRHADYRGPRFTALGAQLAVDGVLDPRALGAAWRSGRHDDQDLERVWHLLARFGRRPATGPPEAGRS